MAPLRRAAAAASLAHAELVVDKHTTLKGFLNNTLDVVFHVAILFTALVLLLQFIIAPLYTEHLTDTVTANLSTAIGPTLFPGLNSKQRDVAMDLLMEEWRVLWDDSVVEAAGRLMVAPPARRSPTPLPGAPGNSGECCLLQ